MNTHHRYRTIPDDDQIAKDAESIRALEEICLYPIEFVATIEQDENGFYLDGYAMYAGGDCIFSEIEGRGKHRSELADMLHEDLLSTSDHHPWLRRPAVHPDDADTITDEDIAAMRGPL